jgi:transcriptional regulator with XRE-family HTH domain
MAASGKYTKQRQPKIPPHVSLKHLRDVSGLTLDQLIERIAKKCDGYRPTRGAISGLENGHRGASERLLRAIEKAYGLPAGSIVTDYVPRIRNEAA